MEDYTRNLCVCSFHMYCDIWEAAKGEALCVKEKQVNVFTWNL